MTKNFIYSSDDYEVYDDDDYDDNDDIDIYE